MDSQPTTPPPSPTPAKLSRQEKRKLREEKLRKRIHDKEDSITEQYNKFLRAKEIMIDNINRMEMRHNSIIAHRKNVVARWKALLETYKE